MSVPLAYQVPCGRLLIDVAIIGGPTQEITMTAITAGTGDASVVVFRPRRLRVRTPRTAPAQQSFAYADQHHYIPTGTADLWKRSKPRRTR